MKTNTAKTEYVIIQAGGRGVRMGHFTENKPKALVPLDNQPLIFHLFATFSNARFIIIADYKAQVLERYLEKYATVKYALVRASGEGNLCGIREALNYVPAGQPFTFIWCDVLPEPEFVPAVYDGSVTVGVTSNFACSWQVQDNALVKVGTGVLGEAGVAGIWTFPDKNMLAGCPDRGSLPAWLVSQNLPLVAQDLGACRSVGTLDQWRQLANSSRRCRPYNSMEFSEQEVVKRGLTEDAVKLIRRETRWYQSVSALGFEQIPRVYHHEPLSMERILGASVFESHVPDSKKSAVLENICKAVRELHRLGRKDAVTMDLYEEYYLKTIRRLNTIRELIPHSECEKILINGRTCCNVLSHPEFLQELVQKHLLKTEFTPIHGDCTFSNTLLDLQGKVFFIDARGYFGSQEVFGDQRYDWAKLYYSVVGNFDEFNAGRFQINIAEEITFSINSAGWEGLQDKLLSFLPTDCNPLDLRLIHAIIWLSLASHCYDDYDALCLAFYNGLKLLDEVTDEYKNS